MDDSGTQSTRLPQAERVHKGSNPSGVYNAPSSNWTRKSVSSLMGFEVYLGGHMNILYSVQL